MDEKSIAALEAQIEPLEKSDTKKNKAEITRLKNNIKRIYTENKLLALNFEKTNRHYIVMVRSTRGFYKLFGRSALYYANDVASKLNLVANLQTDGDYKHKSEYGFISVREPEKIAEVLKTIKITKIKTKDTTGNFILFKLPWEYIDEQVAELIENSHFAMRNFNHIVMVDNILPLLYLQILELTKAIYENVRTMGGPIEREAFGLPCLKEAQLMCNYYINTTNGLINQTECLKKIKHHLTNLKTTAKIIADLKLWTPKVCARIGDIIIKFQEIIEKEQRSIK